METHYGIRHTGILAGEPGIWCGSLDCDCLGTAPRIFGSIQEAEACMAALSRDLDLEDHEMSVEVMTKEKYNERSRG